MFLPEVQWNVLLRFLRKFPWDFFKCSSRDSFRNEDFCSNSFRVSFGNFSWSSFWYFFETILFFAGDFLKILLISSEILARDFFKTFSWSFPDIFKINFFKNHTRIGSKIPNVSPWVLCKFPSGIFEKIHAFFLICSCGLIRNISLDFFRGHCRICSNIPPHYRISKKCLEDRLKKSFDRFLTFLKPIPEIPWKLLERRNSWLFKNSWTTIP